MLELLSDILEKQPGEDAGMESVVIVDGLPVVGADQKERLDKLKNVVRKLIITNTGCQVTDFIQEVYPLEESGATKGSVSLIDRLIGLI